jgi:hypothetical protein
LAGQPIPGRRRHGRRPLHRSRRAVAARRPPWSPGTTTCPSARAWRRALASSGARGASASRAATARSSGRRRLPGNHHAGQGAGDSAREGGRPLPVGRGHGELQFRCQLPARHGRPGDGHRRVQRHRPGTDPDPIRAGRGAWGAGRGAWGAGRGTWGAGRGARGAGRGDVHYFIAGGSGPGQGRSGTTASQITSWVERQFSSSTVNGVTVYDLTTAAVADS